MNLVNAADTHANESHYTYDQIPPLGPLSVIIRTGKKPKSVRLQPANRKLLFTYESGEIKTTIKRLEIHDIIVVA